MSTPIYGGMTQPAGQNSADAPDLATRVAELEAALKAATHPAGERAAHTAGPGDTVAETWSLYDQEQARRAADG